jgi:hypothetical protein
MLRNNCKVASALAGELLGISAKKSPSLAPSDPVSGADTAANAAMATGEAIDPWTGVATLTGATENQSRSVTRADAATAAGDEASVVAADTPTLFALATLTVATETGEDPEADVCGVDVGVLLSRPPANVAGRETALVSEMGGVGVNRGHGTGLRPIGLWPATGEARGKVAARGRSAEEAMST